MAMLFKFLGTMEPRSTELLRKRRDTNEYQSLGRGRARREVPVGWEMIHEGGGGRGGGRIHGVFGLQMGRIRSFEDSEGILR